jgi:hypothetical protein
MQGVEQAQLRARIEELETAVRRASASSGVAGGGITSTFVWRPSGVSSGNVFATWPEVVTAVAATNGDVTIGVDTDLGAAVIAPGTYDLRPAGVSGPVTFVNASKTAPFGNPFITLGPGAVVIQGLTGLNDVSIDNQSTVPVIVNSADGVFKMQERSTLFQEPGAGPFWDVTAGTYSIFLLDFTSITTPGGGTPAVRRSGGSIGLIIEDISSFDANMLTDAGTGTTVSLAPGARFLAQAGATGIIPAIQRQAGSTAIAPGTGKTPVIPVFLTSTAKILVSLKTPVGDANTVKYAALGADRVVGSLTSGPVGSFQISALAAGGGGATNGADTSTIDWEVISGS